MGIQSILRTWHVYKVVFWWDIYKMYNGNKLDTKTKRENMGYWFWCWWDMYIYNCVYIYIQKIVYVCMYVCMYVCIYVYTYIYIYVNICMYIYTNGIYWIYGFKDELTGETVIKQGWKTPKVDRGFIGTKHICKRWILQQTMFDCQTVS